MTTLEELTKALNNDWEGYEELRKLALDVPKYGNDNDYVDSLAIEVSDFYYTETRKYKDILALNLIVHLWVYQTMYQLEKS